LVTQVLKHFSPSRHYAYQFQHFVETHLFSGSTLGKTKEIEMTYQVELQDIPATELIKKYARNSETTPAQILDRVAKGLARGEKNKIEIEAQFREALDYCILGGRINANAGTGDATTYMNCFVQPIADSVYESVDGVPGIMEAVREASQALRLGGGVGYDFSKIRPKGAWIKKTRSLASGPISYQAVFDTMCATVMSAGARRGAQMGVLRCDHPDIEEFIVCKRVEDQSIPWDKRPFRNFNLSVGVTDALMNAVLIGGKFELVHIAEPGPEIKEQGAYQREDGMWVYKLIDSKVLYDNIMRGTYERAEPGVLFLDTINRDNNLRYCEIIEATNPCGEVPIPGYGCCDLGHINLPKLVTSTVWDSEGAKFNFAMLDKVIPSLVRMLDNVLDLTPWPLEQHEAEAAAKRRIGVGLTGLGDVMIMMGLKYSSDEGRAFAKNVMEKITYGAYQASVELAVEREPFPLFKAEKYLEEGTFASRLPNELKEKIKLHGIRNSHLTALAPTGTGSLTFGNNCSSGCEPVFDFEQTRYILQQDGTRREVKLFDYAALVYQSKGGDINELPDYFESVQNINVEAHMAMLEVLAPLVDAAISKTVNVPADYDFADFSDVYMRAWKSNLKGITTYRPNNEIGAVLVSSNDAKKTEILDETDPDRRMRLTKLPDSVMKELRWLNRPQMADGNPSYTYLVESPYGDFSTMIGHFVGDDGTHPFEVWVNGAETPRGLGAVAKTLSADMRTYDRQWLKLKLDALKKCNGQAFDMPMPPTGDIRRVNSPVSAMATLIDYHAHKIGWLEGQCDDGSKMVDAMMFLKEPKSSTLGTLSWTVDIDNASTGDNFAMFVKELEMPDGSRRPYSVWIAGNYPKAMDGLCKLLSIDMRIADPSWIGMKLRKLLSYKEAQGDFFAPVPGEKRSQSYPSTVAYVAALLLHRFTVLGILTVSGENKSGTALIEDVASHVHGTSEKPCPDCGAHTLVKTNGCETCTSCGYLGSCG
jgi:ribonucleoside-diphosphate reductase alpha chain